MMKMLNLMFPFWQMRALRLTCDKKCGKSIGRICARLDFLLWKERRIWSCSVFRCSSKHLHQEQQTWVIRSRESSAIHSPRLCGPIPTRKRIFEFPSWHGQLGTHRSDYILKKESVTFRMFFFLTISSMNSCPSVSVRGPHEKYFSWGLQEWHQCPYC